MSMSIVVISFTIWTVNALTISDYRNMTRNLVRSRLNSTETELMELADELIDGTRNNLTEFSQKLSALMDVISYNTQMELREQDLIVAAIEGLSPNLPEDLTEARGKIRDYLETFEKEQSLDTAVLWSLVRQFTAPSTGLALRRTSKLMVKLVEMKVGVDSPILHKVKEGVRVSQRMLEAKETKPVLPNKKLQPKIPPPIECQTNKCKELLELIYKKADDTVLIPILEKTPTELELARKLMKARLNESDNMAPTFVIAVTQLDISNVDYGRLTMVTIALHKAKAAEKDLQSFYDSLAAMHDVGDPGLGWKMAGNFLNIGSIRDTTVATVQLKRTIRIDPVYTPEQKLLLMKVANGTALTHTIDKPTGSSVGFPRCNGDD